MRGAEADSPPVHKLDDMLELFAIGREVSENLKLDRLLPVPGGGDQQVELAKVKGVRTKEIDKKLLPAKQPPQTDPLAAYVPADQHALFFPSFKALLNLLDEGDSAGTPLLNLLGSAADAQSRGRYERQL